METIKIAIMLKKNKEKPKKRKEEKEERISRCTICHVSPFDKRPEQNLVKEGSEKRGLYVSDFFISTEIS